MSESRRYYRIRWIAVGIILLAGSLAYSNSFRGQFVFDDIPSIVENSNIRSISSLGRVLSLRPDTGLEPGTTVQARPILSLSLALNYAAGGTNPWGYHLTNLFLHLANAILIFSLILGTVRHAKPSGASDEASNVVLASIIALLWVVHPLTTNAVTYIVQRAESLGSCFILLSLLGSCNMEATTGRRRTLWMLLSVVAAFIGVLTKESAVVIPLAVLFYQRSYFYPSFQEWWARRKFYFLSLLGSWIPLAALIWLGSAREGTVGFSARISASDYLLVQGWAILHYLRLAVFPVGLCFDYGESLLIFPRAAFPWLFVTAGLVIVCAGFWWKRPKVGFPSLLFFLLLAPTSSFIPVQTHLVAEHRMYLPLACVLVFLAVALTRTKVFDHVPQFVSVAAVISLALWWGFLTRKRNMLFADTQTLWLDTVERQPLNWRASNNYGVTLASRGDLDKALRHYQQALERFERRLPHTSDSWKATAHVAFTLMQLGRYQEALPYLEQLKAEMPSPQYLLLGNLGLARAMEGKPHAIPEIRKAIELNPHYAEGYNNIGWILSREGREQEAIAEFCKALEIQPAYPEALSNLRRVCQKAGDVETPREYARRARISDPESIPVLIEFANCQLLAGENTQGLALLKNGIAKNPDNLRLRKALGLFLLKAGYFTDGIRELQRVAEESNPADLGVLNNVAWILSTSAESKGSDLKTAERYARKAVEGQPNEALFRGTLAACLAAQGRFPEAVEQLQEGITRAEKIGNEQLLNDFWKRIELYRAGKIPDSSAGRPNHLLGSP